MFLSSPNHTAYGLNESERLATALGKETNLLKVADG